MKDLNDIQRQAVTYINGPLLVLAGAGSGKTTVITEKIAYLINTCDIAPYKIYALTFTNKAANEMLQRIKKQISNANGINISTFHSFGYSILQQEHHVFNLNKNLSIYDNEDTKKLIAEITKVNDVNIITKLANEISILKNECFIPEISTSIQNSKITIEPYTLQIFNEYNQALQHFNAVDLDDLIYLPYKILLLNTDILNKWQNKIYYMLIDECQDTSISQYKMVKLLTNPIGRVTVVGDDQQSIYSWRGAEPENLKLLQQDFPTLQLIKLEQNYRSTNYILECANILMSNNQFLFTKNLWCNNYTGNIPRVIIAKTEEEEAEIICAKILEYKFLHQAKYADFAVLYRNNYQSKIFEKKFRELQIPYQLSGSTSIFTNTEIKDLFAYLRLICNQSDDMSFLRIVNTPKREIGTVTLEKLSQYSKMRNNSLFECCFEIGLTQYLTNSQIHCLNHFTNLINEFEQKLQDTENITVFIADLLKTIQYEEWLYSNSTNENAAQKKWQNVLDCASWIAHLIEKDGSNLAAALQKILLIDMLSQQDETDSGDKIRLSTIHAAKGLEFNKVFLIGVNDGNLPHQNCLNNEDLLAEERRLLYVAITRAKQELTISYYKQKKSYNDQVQLEPSRFLYDIQSKIEWNIENKSQSKEERTAKGRQYFSMLQDILNK